MLIKITREDAFNKYPNFPWCDPTDDNYFFPKVYKSYILTLVSKSAKGRAKALSSAVTKLMRSLDFGSLIFVGDTKIPWLYQDNEYSPVKNALNYLHDNKIGKKFNGALQVDISTLAEFIRHLFWLTRCNASLPSFHFMDPGQNVIGSLCKYGNVHLSTLTKSIDKKLQRSVKQSDFEFLHDTACHEAFSKKRAIKHKEIVL